VAIALRATPREQCACGPLHAGGTVSRRRFAAPACLTWPPGRPPQTQVPPLAGGRCDDCRCPRRAVMCGDTAGGWPTTRLRRAARGGATVGREEDRHGNKVGVERGRVVALADTCSGPVRLPTRDGRCQLYAPAPDPVGGGRVSGRCESPFGVGLLQTPLRPGRLPRMQQMPHARAPSPLPAMRVRDRGSHAGGRGRRPHDPAFPSVRSAVVARRRGAEARRVEVGGLSPPNASALRCGVTATGRTAAQTAAGGPTIPSWHASQVGLAAFES